MFEIRSAFPHREYGLKRRPPKTANFKFDENENYTEAGAACSRMNVNRIVFTTAPPSPEAQCAPDRTQWYLSSVPV